jgi:hypothetical protein
MNINLSKEESDILKCQYCFLHYDYCTCCKYCSALKNTCDCCQKDDPCTQMHPHDLYAILYKNPSSADIFGKATIEDIDKVVMEMYIKDCWPERLKND